MKNIFILLILIAYHESLLAQTEQKQILMVAEQMPQFPGGNDSMWSFFSKNIQYPPQAKENGIQGKVVVQFVVNEDGSLSDVKVLRDIGEGCADEVLRVLKMMPKWSPGIQFEKPVAVRFNLPVAFKIPVEEIDTSSTMPQFPGGEKELFKFLNENINYPKQAIKNNIEGKVFLQFVIQEDGSITDIIVKKSLSDECDAEAIRVAKLLPEFIPAKQKGMLVPVYYVLPISFIIKS